MRRISDTEASRLDREPDCLVPDGAEARTVRLVRPAALDRFRSGLDERSRSFLDVLGFDAEPGSIAALPDPDGDARSLAVGIGGRQGVAAGGELASVLPPGRWRVDPADLASTGVSAADLTLGFCLGADTVKPRRAAEEGSGRPSALLAAPDGAGEALAVARAIRFGRALVNRPANLLGPSELADELAALAERFGATGRRVEGNALGEQFPAIDAVGAGSERPPVVASLRWTGSGAGPDAPLVSLVGKGVCFDTGGYDLKPSAAMLRMKKDMGGAAVVLAAAALVMSRDLPVRLDVRIGCVENSVSGRAMRPSDVIRTRKGLLVEVNNTDAEGRLVLADLLAEAAEDAPDLLLDVATLTGAARAALGPDLPALFTDDDALAEELLSAGRALDDPLWRLPLWAPYASWLQSGPADLANVSNKPMAGAITAALFLRRFVPDTMRWAHVDAYCWNDAASPARPEGGEVPLVRTLNRVVTELCDTKTNEDR